MMPARLRCALFVHPAPFNLFASATPSSPPHTLTHESLYLLSRSGLLLFFNMAPRAPRLCGPVCHLTRTSLLPPHSSRQCNGARVLPRSACFAGCRLLPTKVPAIVRRLTS